MATIADLYLARAQQAGEARRRQGDITAQLFGNLASIVGDTTQRLAQERQEAPIRAQQAEARDLELEQARGQVAAQRQKAQDTAALDAAMAGGDQGIDPVAIEQQLSSGGFGHLVPSFRKSWNDAEAAKAALQKARTDAQTAEQDYLGALAAGVKPYLSGPDKGLGAVQLALQHAKDLYPEADQILQQVQQQPEMLPQLVESLIAQSPTQRKLAGEEQDRALRREQEQRALSTAQQTGARQQQQLEETIRHNKATEAKAAADAGAVPELNPAGLNAAAKMYAQTGQLPAMGMGGKAANVRAAIINRAAELYPDLNIAANKAEYGATSGTLTQLQKQRAAIGAFEQTAQKNIDLFLTQAQKVVDTGSPLANLLVRRVSGNMIGSPDVAAYNAARQVAINEIAKITSNPTLAGQLSDTARKEVETFNPENATLKQTVAVMRLLKQDMANRAQSLDDAIAQQRGTLRGQAASASGRIRAKDQQGNIHEAPAGTPLPAGWEAVP